MHAWEASIDRALVARLARPLVQPGVIRMALVRRILAGIAALTERLPLLARFGRSRELAATTQIVHARWLRSMPEDHPATPPIARPIVHAVPGRAVERPSNPVVTREPEPVTPRPSAPSHTIASGVDLASGPLVSLDPPATVIFEGASHARPSGSTFASPAIAAAQVGEVAATRESRTAALQESSHDLARIADPTIRRSRVGAPLPARPQLAARVEGHGPPPAPLLASQTARATAISRGEAPGRSIDHPTGKVDTHAAAASPVLRVRPRAVAPARPAMIANAMAPASLPVVAVTRAAPPPVPAIRPIVAPLAGPAMPLAGRRRVPSVPARSGDGDPARASELPLAHPSPVAHPPPAAPAASAALPAASAPGPIAAPRPTAQAAVPSAPIDLHRLAEQVQRILVRQAAHTRARQGLPR